MKELTNMSFNNDFGSGGTGARGSKSGSNCVNRARSKSRTRSRSRKTRSRSASMESCNSDQQHRTSEHEYPVEQHTTTHSNESCVVTFKLSIRPINVKSTSRRPQQQRKSPAECEAVDNANAAGCSNNTTRRKASLGKVTTNPFFNFMREFRAQHHGVSQKEMIALGAREWNCLDEHQKEKFKKMAKAARKSALEAEAKRKRKRSCSKHSAKRRRSGSRCRKF